MTMIDTGPIMDRLAKVRDEALDGQAATDAAQALFTSIVSGDTVAAPEPRRARRRVRLLVAAALATGIAATVVVMGPGPDAAVYANSAIELQRDGDHWLARIKDPYADHRRYTEAFTAVGLDVDLRLVPSSPSGVGEMNSMGVVTGGETGASGSLEAQDCADDDCWMTIRVPVDFTGRAEVKIGREAKPGESYQNAASAAAPGEELAGVPLREGRTVARILPEIRKRNLTVTYSRVLVSSTGPAAGGGPGEPGTSLSFEPVPETEVGRDWRVWDAEPVKAGHVRLLVTPDRLPKNPLYN